MGDFVVERPTVDAFVFDVNILREWKEEERKRFEYWFEKIRQSVIVAPVGDHVHVSPVIHFHEDDSRFLSGDVVQIDGHMPSSEFSMSETTSSKLCPSMVSP